MLSLRNKIQLNQDVSCGPGKLSVYPAKGRQGDSYAALVHSGGSVELMLLDREGNILQKDTLTMEDLKSDKTNEIQLLWCASTSGDQEEPLLILAQTNQLLRVAFDRSTSVWKADLNAKQPCWIGALATVDRCVYAGGVEGLWELGIAELQSGNKLASCSVTTISASAQFLAVGHEHGGLTLFTGEPNSWTQSGSLNDGPEIQGSGYCITSLLQDLRTKVLVAAYSNGTIRSYSLPSLEMLFETAAHIRWITQLLPVKGGFVSAAEDGFMHLWKLALEDGGDEGQGRVDAEYVDSLQLADGPITSGATMIYDDGEGGTGVLATVYDRPQLYRLAVYQEIMKDS